MSPTLVVFSLRLGLLTKKLYKDKILEENIEDEPLKLQTGQEKNDLTSSNLKKTTTKVSDVKKPGKTSEKFFVSTNSKPIPSLNEMKPLQIESSGKQSKTSPNSIITRKQSKSKLSEEKPSHLGNNEKQKDYETNKKSPQKEQNIDKRAEAMKKPKKARYSVVANKFEEKMPLDQIKENSESDEHPSFLSMGNNLSGVNMMEELSHKDPFLIGDGLNNMIQVEDLNISNIETKNPAAEIEEIDQPNNFDEEVNGELKDSIEAQLELNRVPLISDALADALLMPIDDLISSKTVESESQAGQQESMSETNSIFSQRHMKRTSILGDGIGRNKIKPLQMKLNEAIENYQIDNISVASQNPHLKEMKKYDSPDLKMVQSSVSNTTQQRIIPRVPEFGEYFLTPPLAIPNVNLEIQVPQASSSSVFQHPPSLLPPQPQKQLNSLASFAPAQASTAELYASAVSNNSDSSRYTTSHRMMASNKPQNYSTSNQINQLEQASNPRTPSRKSSIVVTNSKRVAPAQTPKSYSVAQSSTFSAVSSKKVTIKSSPFEAFASAHGDTARKFFIYYITILTLLRRTKEAERELTEMYFISISKEDVWMLCNLTRLKALIYIQNKKYEDAAVFLKLLLDIGTSMKWDLSIAIGRFAMGYCKFMVGDFSKSKSSFKEAAKKYTYLNHIFGQYYSTRFLFKLFTKEKREKDSKECQEKLKDLTNMNNINNCIKGSNHRKGVFFIRRVKGEICNVLIEIDHDEASEATGKSHLVSNGVFFKVRNIVKEAIQIAEDYMK